MRLLWFMNRLPNIAVAALGYEPDVRGGWLDGLTRICSDLPGVELSVATRSPLPFDSVKVDGVHYVNLSTPRRGRVSNAYRRWFQDPAPGDEIRVTRQLIEDMRPDLIHVHGTESYFGDAVSTCGRPWVVSLQGIPSVIARLQWRGVDSAYLSSIRIREFLSGNGVLLEQRMMHRRARLERSWMPRCQHVIGRTRWDSYVASTLAPTATYHHCDEILRDPFIGPTWNHAQSRADTLLALSGSYPVKGVSDLLAAFRMAADRRETLRLRIVGDWPGTSGERATLARVRQLGLEGQVEVLGLLSAEKLVAEMLSCSAMVHASHIDNSPNSLCEAMMLGVPVVATAVGGVPTLATDGTDALLVQDGDHRALAGAMLEIVSSPQHAAALGMHARATARRRHDPVVVRHSLTTTYGQILADYS